MQEFKTPAGRPHSRTIARRRSEFEIAIAIMAAIQEELFSGCDEACPTRVQAKVILSWNTFKKHLGKLEKKGLVEGDRLRLTENGMELLQAYRNELRPVLNRYGY